MVDYSRWAAIAEGSESSDSDTPASTPEPSSLNEMLAKALHGEERKSASRKRASSIVVPAWELHCTLKYPSGVLPPLELRNFDVRPHVCAKFGSFAHGDIVINDERKVATVIGVAAEPGCSGSRLWLHEEGRAGALAMEDEGAWHTVSCLPIVETDCTARHGTVGIAPPSEQYPWLQATFGYPFGVDGPTTFARFDVRDHTCLKICGFKHGQRVQIPGGQIAVTIGVRQETDGRVLPVFHVKGSPGAGVFKVEVMSTLRARGGVEQVREFSAHEVKQARGIVSVGAWMDPAQIEHSFSYPAGSQGWKVDCFDPRVESCGMFKVAHADVIVDEDGFVGTVIGVRVLSGDGIARLWWHMEGNRGATLFPQLEEAKVLGNVGKIPEGGMVSGKAPTSGSHGWLKATFSYGILEFGGVLHHCLLDIRPGICKAVSGFEHGDVVRDAQGVSSTAIGVMKRWPGGPVGMFFRVGSAAGATLVRRDVVSNMSVIGHTQVQEMQQNNMSTEQLQQTFVYPLGRTVVQHARFDIRHEAFESLARNIVHGDIVLNERGAVCTVIGVAPAPGSGTPNLWVHEVGHTGATMITEVHKLRLVARGQPVLLGNLPCTTSAQEKLGWLKPSFWYLLGHRGKPELALFDIRDEVCWKVGGCLHGEVVMSFTQKVACVTIGVRWDPSTESVNLYFHVRGAAGAGAFLYDDLQRLTRTGTAEKICEAAGPHFPRGSIVQIYGLRKAVDLNGCGGDVIQQDPTQLDRWQVWVHTGSAGRQKKLIHWQNLKLASSAAVRQPPQVREKGPEKAASSSGAPCSGGQFKPGLHVRVLQHPVAKELNGCSGVLKKKGQKGKWHVEMSSADGSVVTRQIKKEHLALADDFRFSKDEEEIGSDALKKLKDERRRRIQAEAEAAAIRKQAQSQKLLLRDLQENNAILEKVQRNTEEAAQRAQREKEAAELEKEAAQREREAAMWRAEKEREAAQQEKERAQMEKVAAISRAHREKEEAIQQARRAEMRAREQSSMQTSATSVGQTWHFQLSDGMWTPFTAHHSNKLTKSFRRGDQICSIVHDRVTYEVSFEDMVQTNCATGRRRQVKCSFGLPAHWVMRDDDVLRKLGWRLPDEERWGFPTPPAASKPTFESVTQQIMEVDKLEEFTQLLRSSVFHHNDRIPEVESSGCNVLRHQIDVVEAYHVENLSLYKGYQDYCGYLQTKHMQDGVTPEPISPEPNGNLVDFARRLRIQTCGDNELLLFHGTSFDTAKKIALEGFDSRLAKESGMYGKGTYFAAQSCKSHQYTDRHGYLHTMVIARVALGDPHYATECNRSLIRPPMRDDETARCDCVIAQPGQMVHHFGCHQVHMEFILFEQKQAYPEYILRYRLRVGSDDDDSA